VLEYASDVKRAEVNQLSIDGIHLTYIHTPRTTTAEEARFTTIKKGAEEVNNKPGLLLRIHQLRLENSYLSYSNDDSDHKYKLYFANLKAQIANLSNHSSEGVSTIDLNGNFMGSGKTKLVGTFRPQKQGPDFDLNLGVQGTNLPALNDLLRAYGKFDVQSGQISVYSQASVNRGEMNGYVKTLFSNVVVYDSKKDRHKPILHQAYELIVGGAAKVLKNSSTQQVATEVSLKGNLNQPNISTWEALKELLHNAFINAIEPGFDREIASRTTESPATSK
jgi:hypothetical protein